MYLKVSLAVSAYLVYAALVGFHSYVAYNFLRLIVCFFSIYSAFIWLKIYNSLYERLIFWKLPGRLFWGFVVIAIAINPFFKIHLSRTTWGILDIIFAGFILFCTWLLYFDDDVKSALNDTPQEEDIINSSSQKTNVVKRNRHSRTRILSASLPGHLSRDSSCTVSHRLKSGNFSVIRQSPDSSRQSSSVLQDGVIDSLRELNGFADLRFGETLSVIQKSHQMKLVGYQTGTAAYHVFIPDAHGCVSFSGSVVVRAVFMDNKLVGVIIAFDKEMIPERLRIMRALYGDYSESSIGTYIWKGPFALIIMQELNGKGVISLMGVPRKQ